MKRATIVEFRNHLSAYLKEVEVGERVLICRRDTIIAELRPAGEATDREPAAALLDDTLSDLERQGLVRRGTDRLPSWCLSPVVGPKVPLLEALLEERDGGR